MTLRLSIDAPRWQRHLDDVATATPGLVPVIKGDGYGLGTALLAGQARRLRAAAVAVGTPAEAAEVTRRYGGEVVVLQPWAPHQPVPTAATVTVARADAVRALVAHPRPPRVIVELDSPMHRHGLTSEELPGLARYLGALPVAGYSLHLPLGLPLARQRRVVAAAVEAVGSSGAPAAPWWLSHVDAALVSELATGQVAGLGGTSVEVRQRVGTRLWLGAREALTVTGEVLDVREVPAGARVGYRQARWAGGSVIVVGGGTAHGVGVRTATAGGVLARARSAAGAVREAAGWAPSPFSWSGRQLRFADLPHMQVSMLAVPAGVVPPRIGDRLPAQLRLTTTHVDEVVLDRSVWMAAA